MIYSKHRFSLEIQSAHSQIAIPVMLGDTGKSFHIALTDGGKPFTIPDGTLAVLTIHRPTGTFLQAFCSIKNNTTIIYNFMQNENTASVEGIHNCELTLYGGHTESVLSTSWFTMVVNSRVVNSDDINITDENRSAIDEMLAAEASRQVNEESRINAESARVSAEEARVEAEVARVAAENARAIAEIARESNCTDAVNGALNIANMLQNLLKNGAFTPVKGVDYFTDADIAQIVALIVAKFPDVVTYDGSVEVI